MAQEITHPTIVDGWFREISDTMWPGQAMTLKVEKVLHHEKSKYQDVLIFKSTTYGNVLVLDNVIQATERDEFAYQEMIAHLALNSHPNPKKVLVIGGGDGGVLREVVKHDSVEEAWLCDIDEAVIRLSKEYLPEMAASYSHPKVKTHIGDGFQFLRDYQNTFDVIITDSSDPEGPAETLFQKEYFQLLNSALTEKGVITTQAESMWIHLPIIKDLKKACSEVFQLQNTLSLLFQLTQLVRLVLWFAPKIKLAMSRSHYVKSLMRRRLNYTDTITRKFTKLPLFYQPGQPRN